MNKGDSHNPLYRSRLVGREFNVGKDDSLYAATPPLEALRMIISQAATQCADGTFNREVMINDVSRAYFYAKPTRKIYIELPTEDTETKENEVGVLNVCLYGTRDAAKGWQRTLSADLISIGFVRGKGHPAIFHHPVKDIMTLVHGDGYCSCGCKKDLDWLEGELKKRYEIKPQRISAFDKQRSEARILNRTVRRTDPRDTSLKAISVTLR